MKPSLNHKALMCAAIVAGIAVLAALHYCGKSSQRTQPPGPQPKDVAAYEPVTKTPIVVRKTGEVNMGNAVLASRATNTSSEVPVRHGPLDPNVETILDGKRMSHQEAIPIIKRYLQGADKGKVLEAMGALSYCNDKEVDEDIIQRVLALYETTPAPQIPPPPTVPSDEVVYDINLKITMLSVMDKCGGRHRDVFLSNAAKDPHPTIRWHAQALIKGEPITAP